MTVKLALRYLIASSGLANCACAGRHTAAKIKAPAQPIAYFMFDSNQSQGVEKIYPPTSLA
jgi:hypothetical protein